MPDDQNTTQNPISTENSIPPSPQEPTEQVPENTPHSEPSNTPSEAPEASGNDFPAKSNDIPPPDSITPEPEKEPEIPLEPTDPQADPVSNGTSQVENEPVPEPISEPNQAPEPETAQIPVNEPLPESEPSVSEAKEEPKPIETPEPEPEKEKPKISYLKSQKWGEFLVMARTAIQFRKRKKLDRIMTLFLKNSKITNDEVEKLLHVSDATATRYLSMLEKEGKVKQNGRAGKGVFYEKI